MQNGPTAARSRSNQAGAGGSDRLAIDDGGHFIATRFNGPSDAFNHFAQDASFNRGEYRSLEDRWSADLRAGKRVSVVSPLPTPAVLNGQTSSMSVGQSPERIVTNSSTTGREGSDMVQDKFTLIGPALNDVGNEAVRLTGGEPDGVFLYVEIGDGWVSTSLFKSGLLTVTYVDPRQSPIDGLVQKAWSFEPADKRWTTMEMTIRHRKFEARFGYEDIDHSPETVEDRRPRVLHAHFGDKPIVYPPLKRRGWDLKPPA